VSHDLDQVYRSEAGRVLATLIRLVGDFDLAEEALQDAFAAAAEQWERHGPPVSAAAWLIGVGRRKAIDRLRRRRVISRKQLDLETQAAIDLQIAPWPDGDDSFGDDMLRLIFTCCHPALGLDAQAPLILNTVCGLSVEAVARAFVANKETMARRLVRAKRKIRLAKIPYGTPEPETIEERVEGVLTAIYLTFNEGYAASTGANLIREDLCREAIRLARLLSDLLPGRAAIDGLLALMLLHDSRRRARASPEGDIILLEDQDRALWDQAQIREGLALVDRALRVQGCPSPYAVQAAIAALHARAAGPGETDWRQIVGLYEVLARLLPSPVVELNRAIAISMVDGPARALDLLDALAARGELGLYHPLPAARAEMLSRLGRRDEAIDACRAALASAKLEPERRLLARRLSSLGG
jgi:RNA polymerase sigma-70 factor (ECF subfamily)